MKEGTGGYQPKSVPQRRNSTLPKRNSLRLIFTNQTHKKLMYRPLKVTAKNNSNNDTNDNNGRCSLISQRVRHHIKHFLCIISLNFSQQPFKAGTNNSTHLFINKEAEAQKGEMTCSRPHNQSTLIEAIKQ